MVGFSREPPTLSAQCASAFFAQSFAYSALKEDLTAKSAKGLRKGRKVPSLRRQSRRLSTAANVAGSVNFFRLKRLGWMHKIKKLARRLRAVAQSFFFRYNAQRLNFPFRILIEWPV